MCGRFSNQLNTVGRNGRERPVSASPRNPHKQAAYACSECINCELGQTIQPLIWLSISQHCVYLMRRKWCDSIPTVTSHHWWPWDWFLFLYFVQDVYRYRSATHLLRRLDPHQPLHIYSSLDMYPWWENGNVFRSVHAAIRARKSILPLHRSLLPTRTYVTPCPPQHPYTQKW